MDLHAQAPTIEAPPAGKVNDLAGKLPVNFAAVLTNNRNDGFKNPNFTLTIEEDEANLKTRNHFSFVGKQRHPFLLPCPNFSNTSTFKQLLLRLEEVEPTMDISTYKQKYLTNE